MYVWAMGDTLFKADQRDEAWSALLGTLTRPHNGQCAPFNRVYLEMGLHNVIERPAVVRAFLARAHAMGLAVEYLDGCAMWLQSAREAREPMAVCDALVAFNAASPNTAEHVDGIHLDIEPHQLPNWRGSPMPNAPDRYNQVHETNLLAIFYHCMHATRHTDITVSWSVGCDYYKYVPGLWRPLIHPTAPFVDYIVVMKYASNYDNYFFYFIIRSYFGDTGQFLNGAPDEDEPGTTVGGVTNVLRSLEGGCVPAVFAAEVRSQLRLRHLIFFFSPLECRFISQCLPRMCPHGAPSGPGAIARWRRLSRRHVTHNKQTPSLLALPSTGTTPIDSSPLD